MSSPVRDTVAVPRLRLTDVHMAYPAPAGERVVLDAVGFEVAQGEYVSVVGPSGCGKTTLLRCIAGLITPTSGAVYFDGQRVDRTPERLALVFQDYSRSLLPWLTIRANVLLPLRGKGIARSEQSARAADSLLAVGLSQAADQYPWQLSGGMQQRAAIARALAYQPEALVMDEPFASVDAQTRSELEDLVLRIRREYRMTVVSVTHDIDEAVYMSDRVVVLSGRPTTVAEEVVVDLGSERDQIATKSDPVFAELRAHVLRTIRH